MFDQYFGNDQSVYDFMRLHQLMTITGYQIPNLLLQTTEFIPCSDQPMLIDFIKRADTPGVFIHDLLNPFLHFPRSNPAFFLSVPDLGSENPLLFFTDLRLAILLPSQGRVKPAQRFFYIFHSGFSGDCSFRPAATDKLKGIPSGHIPTGV